MSARLFLDRYLQPNYQAWLANRLDERLAMNAVLSANQLADWVYHELKSTNILGQGGDSVNKFRSHLVEMECKDFQIIWDVADSHKHFELERGSRAVKSAAQTGVGSLGYGQGGWGEGVWGGGPQIVVSIGKNSKRALSAPMKNVVSMWLRLLDFWKL
jgi:hypothetical protein